MAIMLIPDKPCVYTSCSEMAINAKSKAIRIAKEESEVRR